MSIDATRGDDTSPGSRSEVVADPLRQSLDAAPAPRRVNEFSLWGDRPLEQCAPPLGVSLVPRLEVRIDNVVHGMTLRSRAWSANAVATCRFRPAAHARNRIGTAASRKPPALASLLDPFSTTKVVYPRPR